MDIRSILTLIFAGRLGLLPSGRCYISWVFGPQSFDLTGHVEDGTELFRCRLDWSQQSKLRSSSPSEVMGVESVSTSCVPSLCDAINRIIAAGTVPRNVIFRCPLEKGHAGPHEWKYSGVEDGTSSTA